MANQHGDFLWYELMTADADAATEFYSAVVGWRFGDAQMKGMDYRIFGFGDHDIGGLMALTPDMAAGGAKPAWMGYVCVDDVDKMAVSIADGGGAVHMPPQDIPGVGRFAMVGDPQGAVFYIMKGAVEGGKTMSFSYDMPRIGHIAWNELATSAPDAALHFYGQRFGWVKDGAMDMGPMGSYNFLRHAGRAPEGSPPGQGMLGAIYRMAPQDPEPHWLFYFRVTDIDDAVGTIERLGGTLHQQPTEVPGGDFSLIGVDPQGAFFGLIGSRTAQQN